MKTIMMFTIAASIACASFAVHAKKPHPDPEPQYVIPEVTCECDSVECTVTWTDVDAPTYGADIEFEAEWVDDSGVEMSSSAELDLENWVCDGLFCSASGVFTIPPFAMDAEVKFVGKVKGFQNGREGKTSRDFVKATGACTSPLVPLI